MSDNLLNVRTIDMSGPGIEGLPADFANPPGNKNTGTTKRSVYDPIFNFEPTGLILKQDLGLSNIGNDPIFAIKVSPYQISLYEAIRNKQMNTEAGAGRFLHWTQNSLAFFPMNYEDIIYDDAHKIPNELTLIENDDQTTLSLLARHHLLCRGGLRFLLLPMTNVTTQGRWNIWRSYNVSRPPIFGDPTRNREPLGFISRTQRSRLANSFTTLSLAGLQGVLIEAEWGDQRPYINMGREFNRTAGLNGHENYIAPQESYIFIDISGTTYESAGAKSMEWMLLMAAMPDFEMAIPFPISSRFWDDAYSRAGAITTPDVIRGNSASIHITGFDDFTEAVSKYTRGALKTTTQSTRVIRKKERKNVETNAGVRYEVSD